MIKNKVIRTFAFSFLLVFGIHFLTACGEDKQTTDISNLQSVEDECSDTQAEDPFDDKQTEGAEGSDVHGAFEKAVDSGFSENLKSRTLKYNGSKLSIPYEAESEEFLKPGFLIFVDGIPQPYQIDNPDSDYAYLHILNLEQGVKKNFEFLFEPITGKKGDTLDVYIVCVQARAKDFEITPPFGSLPHLLGNDMAIHYLCDAKETDFHVDKSEGQILGASASNEKLTLDKINFYTQMDHVGNVEVDLDKSIYIRGFLNKEDMGSKPVCEIGNKESIHMQQAILGHPGVKYRTVLLWDFQPLWYKENNYFESKLKKGEANLLDVDLNVKDIKGSHILYAISVPCNASDYPNDSIGIEMCNCMLTGKEE